MSNHKNGSKFEMIVNLAKAINAVVREEAGKTYIEYGSGEDVVVLRRTASTGRWEKYDFKELDKFVSTTQVDVINELEAYRLAQVSPGKVTEPIEEVKPEIKAVIDQLEIYLLENAGKPSISGEEGKEIRTWLVRDITVKNLVGTERWASKLPGDVKSTQKPADIILLELKNASQADIDKAWEALGVPKPGTGGEVKRQVVETKPVKEEQVVVDTRPIKERLLEYLDAQVKPFTMKPKEDVLIWHLPNGRVVTYKPDGDIWRYSAGRSVPPMISQPTFIWDKFHPKAEEVKAVIGMEELSVRGKGLNQIAILEFNRRDIEKAITDKVPYVPMIRKPYDETNRKDKVVFKATEWFRASGAWAEYSPAVEMFTSEPYIKVVSDDYAMLAKLLDNGYPFIDSNLGYEMMAQYPFGGKHWSVAFGYIRDDGGTLYLFPDDSKVKELKDIGVSVFISDPVQAVKAAKYLNRFFAPTQRSLFGTTVSFDDVKKFGVYEWETGKQFSIKFNDLNALSDEDKGRIDGQILVSKHFCISSGLTKKPMLGDAWACTLVDPFGGEIKGHFVYTPGLKHDVVCYGVKSLVKSEIVSFGVLGKLKEIEPRTDLQSWCNFRYDRPGMADYLAREYRKKVYLAMQDEREARKMFLKYVNINEEDRWFGRDQMTTDYETWPTKEAAKLGFPILATPGLRRSVENFFMYTVMDMEKGRIPMSPVAKSGYVIQDPFSFDFEGNLLPEERCFIGDGECVFPDVAPGSWVICYRQPNENQNAWVKLRVVHDSRYDSFKGRGIIILGAGAHKVLARLGGGDYDDRFIVVHDQYWVGKFEELNLHRYPETEKIKAEGDTGEFVDVQTKGKNEYYNIDHMHKQISVQKGNRTGIGPVVNAGMIDYRLSHPEDKAYMNQQLSAMITEAKLAGKAALVADYELTAKWLNEVRKDNQLSWLLSNLELVIDGTVLDYTVTKKLGNIGNAIRQFHSGVSVDPSGKFMWDPVKGVDLHGTLIYPWFAYEPSMSRRRADDPGHGRIPGHKYQKHDFLVLDTLLDKSIKDIIKMRDRLIDIFKWQQWASMMVAPHIIQQEVDNLPNRDFINACLGVGRKREELEAEPGYLQIWKLARDKYLTGKDLSVRTKFFEEYGKARKTANDWLKQFDEQTVKDMALLLYVRLYQEHYEDAERDDAGKRKNYRDGSLWLSYMGNMLLRAMRDFMVIDQATGMPRPLTGLYTRVDLEDHFKWELKDSKDVVVYIKDGNVFRESSDERIGTIPVSLKEEGIEDGFFIMDEGIIELRKPYEQLIPEKVEFDVDLATI